MEDCDRGNQKDTLRASLGDPGHQDSYAPAFALRIAAT
jgi:hypothetical protein